MKELDIDSLMKAMEKPQTGDNLQRVLDIMKNADTVLGQVEKVMDRMDRMGLKPLIVRGLGVQLGIDAEKPLASDSPKFKSQTHQKYIEAVNQMSEAELLKQLGDAANAVENHD